MTIFWLARVSMALSIFSQPVRMQKLGKVRISHQTQKTPM
ncbi:Uncharacterised protein [Enterobacter cloacae]|nr:Uncharacterised protein [Enterobacter cloacae]